MTESLMQRKHEESPRQSLPCAPTRPRSRALFVGLNCAHPSTMTLQSQGLSLQQELYRPIAVTRHPPGQPTSETDTNNSGDTQSNQITKICHVKYHTGNRAKRTGLMYHFNYTLLAQWLLYVPLAVTFKGPCILFTRCPHVFHTAHAIKIISTCHFD
jgi:hypothetical protein